MATVRNGVDSVHSTESLPALLKELRDETTTLLRQEVALAKQEMSETAACVGRNTGYLAAGGMVAYSGLTLLLIAAAAGLYALLVEMDVSHMTAGWLSPLIVGIVVAAIGYGLVKKATATLRSTTLVPRRTVDTMHDNSVWIKEKVTS